MIDRYSLLKALKTPGFEAAVMTTFNCYLPFLEEVVIRRMTAVGCHHNVVLADRSQLAVAIDAAPPRRSGLDYWLLPIDATGSFHPKLLLMVGKDKGQLFVGSHNLTYSGFGGNREVTNVVTFHKRANVDSLPIFKRALEALRSWAVRAQSPGVDQAFTHLFDLAPWLKESASSTSESNHLIVGGPGHAALFSQLTELCPPPVRDIVVSGAFFDSKGDLLQRLIQVYEPNRLIVAIQPDTVQLPPMARSLSGVKFVSAEHLGPSLEDYLHAKFIYLVTHDDHHVLASGSANPSRPAWLEADAAANDEAMLVRRGDAARAAATSIGIDIDALDSQPALTQDQWNAIEIQWSTKLTSSSPAASIALNFAVCAEPGIVTLDTPKCAPGTNFQFLGPNEALLPVAFKRKLQGDCTVLTFDEALEIPVIRELLDDKIVANHLVHYQASLEEHARTGVQRTFRTSLASLDADSPELSTLFRCVEQVILNPENRNRRTSRLSTDQTEDDAEVPGTLQIDINSIASATRRKRLSGGTDLGYILDLLINSLSQATSDNYRRSDTLGRDEEEQVGADDDFDDEALGNQRSEQHAEKILLLCHRKVAGLVRRTQLELERTTKEKLPIDDIALKLTAVLALLRHLKAHESTLWWVQDERGQTAVPRENLQTLCYPVLTFLELNSSMLNDVTVDDKNDLANFEEIGRLKGLVFWLAIESGVHLRFDAEFNESKDRARERIQTNTNFIALGNMMADDSVAVDEARETIRVTNAAAMGELHRAVELHSVLQRCRAHSAKHLAQAEPGDLAFHPTLAALGVRCVLSYDENQAEIARLGRGEPKLFRSNHLRYLSLRQIREELHL